MAEQRTRRSALYEQTSLPRTTPIPHLGCRAAHTTLPSTRLLRLPRIPHGQNVMNPATSRFVVNSKAQRLNAYSSNMAALRWTT